MWKLQDTYHDGIIARATITNEDRRIILEAPTQPDLDEMIKEILNKVNAK